MTATKTPTKKATKPSAKTPSLAQAAAKDEVKFYRQRANGTLRRLPCLAPGTPERKKAEAVAARRDKGETANAIAGDLKLSKATVRRLITGLLLAHAIEAGAHDAAWDGTSGASVLLSVTEAA